MLPDPDDGKTPKAVKERQSAIASILNGTARPKLDPSSEPQDEVINEESAEELDTQPTDYARGVGSYTPPTTQVDPPKPQLTDREKADKMVLDMFGSRRVKVEISNSHITFILGALIHREENSLTLLLDREHVQIKPNPGDAFTLKAQALHCDVLYVGGFFTFPKSSYSLISFLIEKTHGETSSH